jgi:hypothetical protein
MATTNVQQQIQAFIDHLEEVAEAFNGQSDARGLGVHLDVDDLVDQTRRGRNHKSILSFFASERPGVLYREQIVTAVDAIVEIIESPYNLGLILGALQSGKTTTALALQFAGPAVYLVTGLRVFPFYLTTNQNSHEEQLRNELTHFIKYYGGIDVVFNDQRCRLKNYIRGQSVDPVFGMSPNLDTYREVVLQGNKQFHDIYKPATLDDLIHKRVRGQAIRSLAQSCQKMVQAGFTPLLIVDEPQFGASDRLILTGGNRTVVDCLLNQIENEIRSKIGADADRVKAIGLSATPFELHALQRVWKVFQRLGPSYRGLNDFGGQPIDPSVQILPPDRLSMTDAATRFGIPFLPSVNPMAYSRNRSFTSWARKIGYTGSWVQYKQDCVNAIRDLVLALAQLGHQQGKVVGICLRAINDNDRTEQLLADLHLPQNIIEVVKFYGAGGKGMTVKHLIAGRTRPQLPYLFMVTSKARMGDQFPSDVNYFIDFAQKASDLNSLLQGLVGRACGYGKNSLVLLSDRNYQMLDGYVATHGGYVMTPSRHSLIAGGANGIAPRSQITIDRDPMDSTLEAFFQDLDCQVVQPTVPFGPAMAPSRAPKGGRRGAILTLAEGHMVFDHIETAAFRQANLPHVFGVPEIVRRGETIQIQQTTGGTTSASYLTDNAGGCRYNFRKDGYAGRAGIKGRGRGQRDSHDASLNQGILEPSIGLRKRDPASGSWIDNPAIPGEWVAVSITLPLRKPCLMSHNALAGRVSLPSPLCVYDKHMTKRERALRDGRV